jgi:hypothetical protein
MGRLLAPPRKTRRRWLETQLHGPHTHRRPTQRRDTSWPPDGHFVRIHRGDDASRGTLRMHERAADIGWSHVDRRICVQGA